MFQDDSGIPAGLAEGLRGLYEAPVVPESVDRAVLALARARAGSGGSHRRRRRIDWRVGGALAAAAGLALATTVWMFGEVGGARGPGRVGPMGDVDGSGTVDIVDALVLTRAIDGGLALQANWDLTGDGRVDLADVDRIATESVRLEGGA